MTHKQIVFRLQYERSTKNTHRYSDASSAELRGERPMVLYVQKRDMPEPHPEIEVEVKGV